MDADRSAPFGPALARAQEQVSRRSPEDPSSSSAETERSGSDSPSSVQDEVPGEDAAAAEDRARANDTPDALSDGPRVEDRSGTELPDDVSEAALRDASTSGTVRSDVGSMTEAPDAAAVIDDAAVTSTSVAATTSSGSAAVSGSAVAADHPTAKGPTGDGGPSTTPVVEGFAPSAEPLAGSTPAQEASKSVDGDVSSSAAVAARGGNTSSPIGPADAAPVGKAGDAAALVPDSTQPTPQDVVGDRSAAAATTTSGPDRPGRPGAEAVPASVAAALAQTANTEESSTPAAGHATATADESAPVAVSGNSAAADGAEGLVVSAREAGRTETVRAAASTPTPGPLNTAEGSIWEDVRMAFDRIRSTGDGQEVRIRLRPAELGELVVQVRTQGEQVTVRLTASSQAAQQALLDDRLRLATELARAGFEEGSVDIGRDDGGTLGQPGQETDRKGGRGRTAPDPVAGSSERSPLERRDPIRTDSGIRPGRYAYSTINLTL